MTAGRGHSRIAEAARARWRTLAERSVDEVCRAVLHGGPVRRGRVVVVVVEVVRECCARSGSLQVLPRIFAAVAAASRDRGSAVVRSVARAHCTNDPAAKSAEVSRAVDALSTDETRERVFELHRRGALRHEYDVAYAVVMMEHLGRTVDEVAAELERDYVEAGHRCDRVYPPS